MTRNTLNSLLIASLLLIAAPASSAVLCDRLNPAVPETTPEEDFIEHDDGTVTHVRTGLMWMRCSLGQTWDPTEESCSGSPSLYTWKVALQAGVSHEFAGHDDWRLPNKNELESVVERSCWAPAINGAMFPDTPAPYDYWSASPSPSSGDRAAWFVGFEDGDVSAEDKYMEYYVRLVRGGQ